MEIIIKNLKKENERYFSFKKNNHNKNFKEKYDNNSQKRANSYFQRKDKIFNKVKVNLLKKGNNYIIIIPSYYSDKNEEKNKPKEYVIKGYIGKLFSIYNQIL